MKKAVKQEVKIEPPSSAPSTPVALPKRPRAISGEMSLRKRPGAVTRALKALHTSSEKDEDSDVTGE